MRQHDDLQLCYGGEKERKKERKKGASNVMSDE